MRSRKYTKRIELWSAQATPDGIGGFIDAVPIKVGESWANIVSFKVPSSSQYASNEFLKNETGNGLKVTTRARTDFSFDSFHNYIVYRDVKYKITSTPTNVDFKDNEIQFIITKEVKITS